MVKRDSRSDCDARASLRQHQRRLINQDLATVFERDEQETQRSRLKSLSARSASITVDFSRHKWDAAAWKALEAFAQSQRLIPSLRAMLDPHQGRPIPMLRSFSISTTQPIAVVRAQMKRLCSALENKQLCHRSGKNYQAVLQLGIGGSAQGAKLLWSALKSTYPPRVPVHFCSSKDGHELKLCLHQLHPATTLVVVMSKSLRTEETLANFERVRRWQRRHGIDYADNTWVVSSDRQSAQAMGFDGEKVLQMPHWLEGRYGIWGAQGIAVALSLGWRCFERFLQGAEQMDVAFKQQQFAHASVRLALADYWERNMEQRPGRALIAYDARLKEWPTYIQQLEMESNGKSHDQYGRALMDLAAPIVYGHSGSEAEHTFFQQLHQGQALSDVDLIFSYDEAASEYGDHRFGLKCAISQAFTLMYGDTEQSDASLSAAGNRSSNLIAYPKLSAEILGQLIALYEYRTLSYAALLDVNAFDQRGVESVKRQRKCFNDLVGGRTPRSASIHALLDELGVPWSSLDPSEHD